MSRSSDGIICYGYDLDGLELPWEEYEFEEWYIHAILGINISNMDYSERYAIKSIIPLDVVYHCCDEDPMYILAIANSVQKSSRGNPTQIDFNMLSNEITQEKLDKLNDVFKIVIESQEDYDSETLREPKWWLASWLG